MPCARKKVVRKKGKRYYRAGKSGLVRLKGGKKPPRRRNQGKCRVRRRRRR